MTVPQFAARVHAVIARPGTGQPGHSGEAASAPAAQSRASALMLLRRHWLISLLLLAGVVLRVLTSMAYHPALLYVDTLKYLYKEWPGADPLGYKVLLKVMLSVTSLGAVAVLQHLLGLAMAVALYAVLVRRGAARWLAAVAAAPVLLDAYQLQMEQMIMPDVLFEAMIVAGLVVLLWRPVVTTRLAIVAGVILGASAAVHQIGEILVLPAVAYLILTTGGWRRVLRQSAVLVAAFIVPIVVYCTGSLYVTGHFWLASTADQNLGRLAVSADCATLKLPSYLRQMCPSPSVQANGADWLEHSKNSPLHNPVIPAGMTKGQMLAQLESAIEHQQPLRVLGSFLRDSARLFAGSRTAIKGITPISRWQFQTRYPVFPPEVSLGAGNKIIVGIQRAPYEPFHERLLRPSYGGRAQVDKPIASFLRSYQLKGGYTPGLLLALATILGAIGTLFVLRRRQRGTRQRELATACLLVFATAALILLISDFTEFSWRYQLPALVTLPPAGVLGVSVLVAQFRDRRQGRSASGRHTVDGPAPRSPSEQSGAVG
ncbi:MAG: hypothetical protein ACRDRJ_16420 [Streptosporangiaceae bacterium]